MVDPAPVALKTEPPALSTLAAIPASDVLARLVTTPDGLSDDEAASRQRRFGPNTLPRPKGRGFARQLADQLVHFFALMLWTASVLAFVGGMPQLGWAIIAVVVVNGAFAFAQEYRAERATHALAALLPSQALVRRSGRKTRVSVNDIVPGDLLLLREGDRIPADGRVLSGDGLTVDNSTLTGESEPVPRRSGEASPPVADPTDADNLVLAGTHVTSGSATVIVLATGPRTRLGGISRLTGEVVRRPTPLRVQLNRAVRVIATFAVGAGVLFFAVSLGLGTPARDGFLFAVGVIVALVPEGLLPTLSLSLAMSATRMAHRGALVRHLESVETLGCTTVICSDKTGTMTANQMTVSAVAVVGVRYSVSGSGYEPSGTLLSHGRPLSASELERLEPLLRAAALCGDARVEQRNGRWRASGDPTEAALVVLAQKGGITREAAERTAPRVREFPFESARRRMSTVHTLPSGEFRVLAKGSPEAVLAACSALSPEREATVLADVEALAADGLRVLALAERPTPSDPSTMEEAERDLELLGLVGIADPVRPEVPDAMARCATAGIRVLMVTGDHPTTAATVARKAGLPPGRVVLGAELPDDEALAELLQGPVRVLARIAPEQKLRIAHALQARGEVVAMTGDGVNDGPALRQADIGVAMGVAGTDVAREAADLVLLDDNFAHIVEAVEEGRAAFDNIRRFLTYHLTDNVAELAPFLAWALSGGRVPLALSVLQILALDIGTDLVPALALGAERPEPGTMERAPRPRRARLLDRRVLGRAFGFLGPVEAVVSLALLPVGAAVLFGWAPGKPLPPGGVPLATLSTMIFASIVGMQMVNAFECRSTPSSLRSIGPLTNWLLVWAVAVEGLALLAFVYLPPLRHVLGQQALGLREWATVLVSPWLLLAAEESRKAIVRRRADVRP